MSKIDSSPVLSSMSASKVEKRQLWMLGLMHSGTTILWRSWRKDKRFLCFDEPLSGLGVLPEQNSRSSYHEFIELLNEDPKKFWTKYAPLRPLEELDSTFTDEQIEYIRFLFSRRSCTAADETHLHLHLPSMVSEMPEAYVIHIHRRASAFVSSHLRPTESQHGPWPRRFVRLLRRGYNKHVFWTRRDLLPGLRRDEVIGRHPLSKFGLLLADAGYDAERIMAAPAVVRLLAYWHYHYQYLEREGPRLYGERFISLPYEIFVSDPRNVMGKLYDWIGLPTPEGVDYLDVHAPKPAYRAGSRRWREAAKIAGFSDEEIETLL